MRTPTHVLIYSIAMAGMMQAEAAGPKPQGPMELKVVPVGPVTLAAAPAGGFPSHAYMTFTSSRGPFCIQGFTVDTFSSQATGPGDAGDITIALSRINGSGLSYQSIRLYQGSNGGASPLDIALSYGNPICASRSIQFHLLQWAASQGSGVPFDVIGQAIVLAGKNSVITTEAANAE